MVIESDRHVRYLTELADLATRTQPVANARFASSIVIGNEVISTGINQLKSHPFQAKYSKNQDSIFFHSEIAAINKALKFVEPDDLKKAILYIARVKWANQYKEKFIWGLARPCFGCSKAIGYFGIKKVIFTTNEQSFDVL